MVDPHHKHSFDFTTADSIDFMPCPLVQCPVKAAKVEKDLEQPSTRQFKKFPTSTGARPSTCAFCSGPDFLRGAASGPRGREKELGAAIGPLGSAEPLDSGGATWTVAAWLNKISTSCAVKAETRCACSGFSSKNKL